MNGSDLNALVAAVAQGGTLKLDARKEYQGPLVLRQPLVVQGRHATIWAAQGPVLTIEAAGVVLQDLNVEITEDAAPLSGEAACALVVRPVPGVALNLHHVAVRGNVQGLDGEEGVWRYPRSLRLRTLKANISHTFRVRLFTPVPCTLRSEVTGLRVEPQTLAAGPNEVSVRLEPLAPGTRLRHGYLLLQTPRLTRRIAVTGQVPIADTAEAVVGTGLLVYAPADWDALTAAAPSPPMPPAPPPLLVEPPPRVVVDDATVRPAPAPEPPTGQGAIPPSPVASTVPPSFREAKPAADLFASPTPPTIPGPVSGFSPPVSSRRKTGIPGAAWSSPIGGPAPAAGPAAGVAGPPSSPTEEPAPLPPQPAPDAPPPARPKRAALPSGTLFGAEAAEPPAEPRAPEAPTTPGDDAPAPGGGGDRKQRRSIAPDSLPDIFGPPKSS